MRCSESQSWNRSLAGKILSPLTLWDRKILSLTVELWDGKILSPLTVELWDRKILSLTVELWDGKILSPLTVELRDGKILTGSGGSEVDISESSG